MQEKVAPFSVPQATAPEEPEEPISEPITISADPTNVRQIPLEDMNRLRIEDLCTIWRVWTSPYLYDLIVRFLAKACAPLYRILRVVSKKSQKLLTWGVTMVTLLLPFLNLCNNMLSCPSEYSAETKLNLDQVSNLAAEVHSCHVFSHFYCFVQEYLEAMSSILGGGPGQVDVDPNEVLAAGDKERVVLMVRELARLSQVIAHYQSSMFLKFQNTNLESLAEEKAPRLHWRSVLVSFPSLHTNV